MAESIFKTLARKTIAVVDKDTELTFNMPEWMCTDGQFETREELVDHLNEHGILHEILQSGIKHELIAIRAQVRPSGKEQKFEQTEAEERLAAYKPSLCVRPKAGGGKREMTAEEMLLKLSKDFTPEQLEMMLKDAQKAQGTD